MLPQVAIVGRPNVGKSSLVNMLAGRRVSIVEPTPGVTRDRVTTEVALSGGDNREGEVVCELVDTGGYGIYGPGDAMSPLTGDVEKQIGLAVEGAALILFVIDAQTGVTALDRSVAELLRKRGSKTLAKVVLVANKTDNDSLEADAQEGSELGFGPPLCVSAATRRNKRKLMGLIADRVAALPTEERGEAGAPSELLLAIVGKRNAGKSTLVNTLAGQERVIASEIPGTTRDSIDVRFEMDGRTFTAIDTAGLRKRKSFEGDIEYYAAHRALRAIRRADVVMLLLDALDDVSQVDKKLGSEITDQFKPCVVVVNKWDLVESKTKPADYLKYLEQQLKGLSYCPIAFISAKGGGGVKEAVEMALRLHEQASKRVSTGELNRIFKGILTKRGPTPRLGQQAKIFYVTQIGTNPPALAMVVNNPDLFDQRYQRYIMNRLRETTPFEEVPIRLLIRPRRRGDAVEAEPVWE